MRYQYTELNPVEPRKLIVILENEGEKKLFTDFLNKFKLREKIEGPQIETGEYLFISANPRLFDPFHTNISSPNSYTKHGKPIICDQSLIDISFVKDKLTEINSEAKSPSLTKKKDKLKDLFNNISNKIDELEIYGKGLGTRATLSKELLTTEYKQKLTDKEKAILDMVEMIKKEVTIIEEKVAQISNDSENSIESILKTRRDHLLEEIKLFKKSKPILAEHRDQDRVLLRALGMLMHAILSLTIVPAIYGIYRIIHGQNFFIWKETQTVQKLNDVEYSVKNLDVTPNLFFGS